MSTQSFTRIASLVPQTEAAFEPQAVGEGIWLTAAHMASIETALQASETALDAQISSATLAATALDEANTMVAAEQANMATATETIATLNAEITELKAKTALPIAAPAALDADNMEITETLATAKTSWDLQLEAARNKFK